MGNEPSPPADRARFPDLAGKVAVVTGASRGIGCGIAEVLARQEMRLVLAGRSAERGEAFADGLRRGGTDAVFVAADVSTADGARAVFDAALERFGRVHLLVNNAAITRSKAFLQVDEKTWHDNVEANLRMIYGPSLLAARHMADSGGGVILHISSVGGLRGHRGMAAYDASKGAIDALTRAMAVDLAPHGIRVNAVAPGATRRDPPPPTPHERDARAVDAEDHRAMRGGSPHLPEAARYIPLGRIAERQEIGLAVAFLASDAAAYITGQVLYVDGGLTAQLSPPGIFV